MTKIQYTIIFLSILGFAGCMHKTEPQTEQMIVKKEVQKDSLLDFELDDDFFRSINTVDAHDERDTIYGNFTGRGRDMLYVLTAPTDSVCHYIDTTRVQNWQPYE